MNRRLPTSRLTLVLAAALAAACASAPRAPGAAASGGPKPAWVDGESSRWPRAGYVLGVGSADDQASAEDRARGEVARVFTADVSVQTTVDESESNSDKGHSFTQTVAENVRTTTRKVLEGVDIVARWKDATGRYYALAALLKSQGLLAVTEKTQAVDDEAGQWKKALDASTDKFERAKDAAKLVALVKSRADLDAERRVLGGGPAPDGSVDAGAARAEAAKALAALDVVVSVSGDGAEAVATGIISGLNAAGLSAKRGGPSDPADLRAEAAVTAAPADSGDPRWKRERASASVTLEDGRQGKAFARFDASAREDSIDPAEARRRALASLSREVSEKVSAAITSFFADQN